MANVKFVVEPRAAARCALALALLAVAACGAGRGPAHVAEPTLAFVHVAVVDVERGDVIPDRTVIVAGGQIAAVGTSTATAVPARATVVDARGKYLIPGLWDMHVHTLYDGRPELMFPMLIANGITSVRDMHTFAADPLGRLRTYRAGVANGAILGPRIIGAGYILDGPGRDGPPEGFHVVRTPDEARREVDTLVAGGADFIKVYSHLSPAVYEAIVDEAKRKHIPFAGHVPDAIHAMHAADAGQRTFEHLFGVLEDCSADRDALVSGRAELDQATDDKRNAALDARLHELWERDFGNFDVTQCDELFAHMRRADTWATPTLVVFEPDTRDIAQLLSDPRLRFIPSATRAAWADDARAWRAHHDAAQVAHMFSIRLQVVAAMQHAGVGLLAGTDIFNPFTFPGFSLHDELSLLVRAGLTPAEALRTATINPARALGLTASSGTVQPGKRADMVLLDANPLLDIANTRKIAGVVVNARYLDRHALDELLATAARVANGQATAATN